jgi:hypothetical protein
MVAVLPYDTMTTTLHFDSSASVAHTSQVHTSKTVLLSIVGNSKFEFCIALNGIIFVLNFINIRLVVLELKLWTDRRRNRYSLPICIPFMHTVQIIKKMGRNIILKNIN